MQVLEKPLSRRMGDLVEIRLRQIFHSQFVSSDKHWKGRSSTRRSWPRWKGQDFPSSLAESGAFMPPCRDASPPNPAVSRLCPEGGEEEVANVTGAGCRSLVGRSGEAGSDNSGAAATTTVVVVPVGSWNKVRQHQGKETSCTLLVAD